MPSHVVVTCTVPDSSDSFSRLPFVLRVRVFPCGSVNVISVGVCEIVSVGGGYRTMAVASSRSFWSLASACSDRDVAPEPPRPVPRPAPRPPRPMPPRPNDPSPNGSENTWSAVVPPCPRSFRIAATTCPGLSLKYESNVQCPETPAAVAAPGALGWATSPRIDANPQIESSAQVDNSPQVVAIGEFVENLSPGRERPGHLAELYFGPRPPVALRAPLG